MKTAEDLWVFYNDNLLPELTPLEQERKGIAAKLQAIGFSILGAVLLLGAGVFMATQSGDGIIWVAIIALIAWGLIYARTTANYKSEFKDKVIARLVKFFDPSLKYEKNNYVPLGVFQTSSIFLHHVDHYGGDDCVYGMLGQTGVQFSEIWAKYETRDSKGRRQEHTIFKGLFFVADFPKNFSGKTVVLPDAAERMFGGVIGNALQSMNMARGQLVKLEDPEFEKEFVVYGSDQIEARYILSTSLMKRIVDFKRKSKKNIHLSFVGSKIFVAISYGKNLFEPRVFRTLIDFTPIREYFEDLSQAVSIVEELNLNTRIWSK